jgi:hypothetical protein
MATTVRTIPLSDPDSRRRLRHVPWSPWPTPAAASSVFLPGLLSISPLELHWLLLEALQYAERDTRVFRNNNKANFYDDLYPELAPLSGQAVELASCQYETLAAWLAAFAVPYLESEEREAGLLACDLAVVSAEDGWRSDWRARAGSRSHAVYNRATTSQAGFAVAGAASGVEAYDGCFCVKRVCEHVFHALAQGGGDWRTPLLALARVLHGRAA